MNLAELAPLAGSRLLQCVARVEETPDCASFVFEHADGHAWDFQPGQFVLLTVEVQGERLQRAYSIASSPDQPQQLRLAIKRVAGGRVSNWLLDHVQPGHRLPMQPPAGGFYLDRQLFQAPDSAPRAVALLSAGSGITPMLAMLQWLVEREAPTRIHFIHSARHEIDLIAYAQVQAWAQQCPRLQVHWLASQPQGGDRPCLAGRLDASRLQQLLPDLTDLRAYACGPESYMAQVQAQLLARGLPAAHWHQERFGPALAPTAAVADASAGAWQVEVPAYGRQLQVSGQESLLDALEREGLPILGACRSGVCGSCKCQVLSGQVQSSSVDTLSPEEQAQGYVLACSTVAQSDLRLGW